MNEAVSLKLIPQELKFNALWCGWKLTEKGKVPFNLNDDSFAKSNDPSTFVSYPTMLRKIAKYLVIDENGAQKGGVGLGIFKGYSAIDIDHCVDEGKNLSPMAADIVGFCRSYTEYSPSGTGIRIIFKTNVKIDKADYYINNHNNGLEIYISDNTNKFVTITGNRISDEYAEIKEVDITDILDKYMRKSKPMAQAFSFENALQKDAKLSQLWFAQAPGSHSNESEMDMALCCKLAYYYKGDAKAIESMFRQSPFYQSKDESHKSKWERQDYVSSTIQGAIGMVSSSIQSQWEPLPSRQRNESAKKYELNDTGNARRFVERFGSLLHWNVNNNVWMIWNDKYWQSDIKDNVKNYAEILAEEMMFEANSESDIEAKKKLLANITHIYNTNGKDAMLKEARHIGSIPVTNEEFDAQPYLLCCGNGIADLESGAILEPKQDMMISMTTGSDIDMDNEPKMFLKFIDEIFQGNANLIHYVQKALGYSMSNATREQCMFILYGDGNNGKSLLLDVIREALGSYGISTRPQLLTEQRNGNTNLEEIARLKGKRFIVVEETKASDKLDESLVKSLTSGIGNQVARFLYGNSFEFPVTGKIWMASNYKPTIRGTDKGIWRRIKVIPLNVDFEGREDKDLKAKLLKELPQILGWLAKGLRDYLKEGLDEPKEVNDSIREYREEMDIVAKWISENCETAPNYWSTASDLFENFNAYCKAGKEFEMSQTLFGRNMGKKYAKRNYGGRNVYIGIRVKKASENLAKKVAFDSIKVDGNV